MSDSGSRPKDKDKAAVNEAAEGARQLASYLDVHGANFRAMTELFTIEIKPALPNFPPGSLAYVGEYRHENLILYLVPQDYNNPYPDPSINELTFRLVAFYSPERLQEKIAEIASSCYGGLDFWKAVISSTLCESSPFVSTAIMDDKRRLS